MDEQSNFGYLLVDTSRLYLRRFTRRAAALGVNLAQSKALGYLSRNQGITQVRLAELTDIEPMTLGRILDRMERDGWIERRSCPSDRRAKCLHLRPAARRILAQLGAIAAPLRAEAIAGVPERKRKIFVEVLAHLYGTLSAPDADDRATGPARAAASNAKPVRKSVR